ncbi:unnamed protein product [Moneuplotes crassus]|uniref:Uncharacterized protein n=1 Tax=Euplotes crassus TaxID=5936 RepID=A0AAD1U758_EUPCR|nr:unnamed protein product [Moneuplotes crassus]
MSTSTQNSNKPHLKILAKPRFKRNAQGSNLKSRNLNFKAGNSIEILKPFKPFSLNCEKEQLRCYAPVVRIPQKCDSNRNFTEGISEKSILASHKHSTHEAPLGASWVKSEENMKSLFTNRLLQNTFDLKNEPRPLVANLNLKIPSIPTLTTSQTAEGCLFSRKVIMTESESQDNIECPSPYDTFCRKNTTQQDLFESVYKLRGKFHKKNTLMSSRIKHRTRNLKGITKARTTVDPLLGNNIASLKPTTRTLANVSIVDMNTTPREMIGKTPPKNIKTWVRKLSCRGPSKTLALQKVQIKKTARMGLKSRRHPKLRIYNSK